MVTTLRWDFPAGRELCADPPTKDSGMVMSRAGAVRYGGNLEIIANQLSERGVNDPARCAKWLQIYMQTFAEDEPVRAVEMTLSNFPTALVAGQATYAWLEQMEATARAEWLENADVPDL